MKEECVTIGYLKQVATTDEPMHSENLAGVAASALRIIADVREYRMTGMDVECLQWLVDSIFQQGHGALLSHLRDGAPDCEICAALAARMNSLPDQV